MTDPRILLCTLPIVAPGQEYKYMDKTKAYRQPRLGAQAIRDHVIRIGHAQDRVLFYDIEMLSPTDDEIRSKLLKVKPDIVGLSAVLSHSYLQVKRVAKIIKEVDPDCWIVVGGHLTASARVVLCKTEVDVCIVGDGEEPFSKFVEFVKTDSASQLENLADIPGVCVRNGDNILFSEYAKKPSNEILTMPDYEFFKSGLEDQPELLDRYFQPADKMVNWFALDPRSKQIHRRPNTAQVPTTKGCTARCTFCQRSTKGYRLANINDLERHIIEIIEKYDVGYIDVLDENFGSRRDHARAFADLMKKYDLLWTATGVRCTNVNRADVEYFKASGCCSLKFGVESGSQTILDIMEKNFTVEQVENALSACWDNDIYSPLALMVGMPGEGDDTIRETGEWIGKMAYKLGLHPESMRYAVFYALPFPGTPLYEYCVQRNLIGDSVEEEEDYLVSLASAGTNKWCYLNVNGASPANVLSWDHRMIWQAQKTFSRLNKKTPIKPTSFAIDWMNRDEAGETIALKRSLTKNGILSLYALEGTSRWLFRTRSIKSLPVWLGHLVIKSVFYSAVLAYSWIGRLTGRKVFMLYKDRPKPERFNRSESSDKRLKRSLRAKVVDARTNRYSSDQKNRAKLLEGVAG